MTARPSDLDVFLSHRTALVAYAASIVGCPVRAEDIVQEAFLNFELRGRRQRTDTQQADGQPSLGRPVSFFYRVVRNAAIDWLRRAEASNDLLGPDELDRFPSVAADPEKTAEDREQLRILAEALSGLPERTRIAFDMHRLEGRSLKDIADRLGVSVVRAHQLVKDAIRRGAAALDAQDEND